ncbi:hypothetical protein Pmani_029288 [Petrolisthes manimaculis]|uniref:Uncharacterized protein n=1 Tax=Petrolisthes manimaculis TaxID=1843537 RepID=A0AAE1NYB9_9EUCA|nr:hypothetical protein Pmani_029288 [Petrolisthes manimaculis]
MSSRLTAAVPLSRRLVLSYVQVSDITFLQMSGFSIVKVSCVQVSRLLCTAGVFPMQVLSRVAFPLPPPPPPPPASQHQPECLHVILLVVVVALYFQRICLTPPQPIPDIQ